LAVHVWPAAQEHAAGTVGPTSVPHACPPLLLEDDDELLDEDDEELLEDDELLEDEDELLDEEELLEDDELAVPDELLDDVVSPDDEPASADSAVGPPVHATHSRNTGGATRTRRDSDMELLPTVEPRGLSTILHGARLGAGRLAYASMVGVPHA
jgi:hypothetical protein